MLRFDAVPESLRLLLPQLASLAANLGFALGGGTSLALRLGHRLSVDLDFFTAHEFAPEVLWDSLKIDGATVIGQATNTLTLEKQGVKLDFLRHAYRVLEPVEWIDGVPLISLPDTVAMKLNALANRGSKKDFFDFFELLDHLTLSQMLEYYSAKYPASDPFIVIRSLVWFEDAEVEPDPISLKNVTWAAVQVRASQAVKAFS